MIRKGWVWWLRNLSYLDTQLDPAPECVLPDDRNGFYPHEFLNIKVGEYLNLPAARSRLRGTPVAALDHRSHAQHSN
jgi:hypothetical protein